MKQLAKRIFQGLGPATTHAEQAHNALVISLVTAVYMAVTAATTYFYFLWQGLVPRGVEVFAAFTVAALVSAWLSWRGRYRLGIVILLATIMFAVLPYRETVLAGQGITVAVMILIAVTGVATAALPAGWAAVAVLAGLLVGVGYVLYDLYGVKVYVEPEYTMTLVIGAVETLVYAFYVRGFIRSLGLRSRLVLAFILVALVPLVVLSAMNSQRLVDLQTEEANRELVETAEQMSRIVDTYLQTQMDTLRTEARIPDVMGFVDSPSENQARVRSVLHTLSLRETVFITSYAILDRDGNNILDTAADNIGRSEADHSYFQTPMVSGRPYVSPVSFFDDDPRLYVSSPIRDASGEAVGVLRAEYNAVVLQWLVRKNARSDVHSLYVVLVDDESYLRLAHSASPQTIYHTYAKLSETQLETLQKLGRFPAGTVDELSTSQPDMVDGLQRLDVQPIFVASSAVLGDQAYVTAQRITQAPWLIIARMSVASVREAVNAHIRGTTVFAFISIVLVALAGLLMTQMLTAPIVRLTRIAEQVAGGDLAARAQVGNQDEIGKLAGTFNMMTAQLQETLTGLEQRITARTRALELSADVSRRLSTILDPSQLVSEVVDLLQFAFNYYHVHIYLMDQQQGKLVMAGGTGEAGKIMLERRHSLPLGQGLVGQACATGDVILSADTHQDPNWLPNPLLPETRSELAVPILLGDAVLGARDVQHNVANGLGQQDAELLRSVANQLAIALRNARQYEQAQHQAQQETLTVAIVDQIQKTESMPDALQVAVRELGRALSAPRTGVRVHVGADNGGASNGGANNGGAITGREASDPDTAREMQ